MISLDPCAAFHQSQYKDTVANSICIHTYQLYSIFAERLGNYGAGCWMLNAGAESEKCWHFFPVAATTAGCRYGIGDDDP